MFRHIELQDAGRDSSGSGPSIGSGRRVLLITSSTVSSEEVQGFISDPATRIRDYDVVLTSPSLGTGVDISLADNSKLVDVVFGFFEPHTNYFEIDQQLARYETLAYQGLDHGEAVELQDGIEIVREDIMRQSLFKNVLRATLPRARRRTIRRTRSSTWRP